MYENTSDWDTAEPHFLKNIQKKLLQLVDIHTAYFRQNMENNASSILLKDIQQFKIHTMESFLNIKGKNLNITIH